MDTQKNDQRWPLKVKVGEKPGDGGQWQDGEWVIESLLPGDAEAEGHNLVVLQLHRDQRLSYRFNLHSQNPTLFILCHQPEGAEKPVPARMTASQDEAASYLDGEHLVLHCDMPPAVQLWMERYMLREGEPEPERKKKKHRKAKDVSNGRQ